MALPVATIVIVIAALVALFLLWKVFKIATKILLVVAIVGGVAIAAYLIYPAFNVVEMDEATPIETMTNATILAQGAFVPVEHEVAGQALLISDGEKTILRFENFETINGPDLRIYLSTSTGIDDFIDLGPIQATKGNVNYELDPSIDTTKYKYVLVWCRAFGVLFSYAVLI